MYLPLVTMQLLPYIDNFDDPTSGWYEGSAIRWGDWCRYDGVCHEGFEEVAHMYYQLGWYHMYIPLTWHGGGDVDTWFVHPVQLAPLPDAYYPLPENYCIEVRGEFANAHNDYEPWWAHWGIVFGATSDLNDVYAFQINANHAVSVLWYENYTYPGNRRPINGEPSPDDPNIEHKLVPWAILGDEYDSTDPHTLRVVVKGNAISVYADGLHTNTKIIPGLPREGIGLVGGVWEVTPADIAFDYFKYEPNCTE